MKRIGHWNIALRVTLLLLAAMGMAACETNSYFDASRMARSSLESEGPVDIDRASDPLSQETTAAATGDELWVIARPDAAPAEQRAGEQDDRPGSGAMVAMRDSELVPMPLKHTQMHATILGYIASVDVTQQFHNPYDEKIEAVYVFPLPHDAAVNEFVMTIGERRIRGIIRQRDEAVRLYNDARAQGYVASLLTQERPNIFTQKVANIEPGKQVDVNIRYFHTLTYDDGWYEFVFPMVVGPRYNPAHTTDGIGAVARDAHGQSTQPTEVQYLRPTERSGHDIDVTVALDAGVEIEEAVSTNHRIARVQADVPTFSLAQDDRVPNKDFVLRYRVAGETIKSNLVTYRDKDGQGYFTLMVYPPQELSTAARQPMEMVFVIDCSGSMDGAPIAQAKAAVRHGLQQLLPDDTFQVIRFSENATLLSDRPLAATPANLDRARRYVNKLDSEGGTEMIHGIRAALDFPYDSRIKRQRIVAFLTDGYIGNEREILHEVQKRLGPARIFSFGVGTSTNRYLLDQMALVGRGAVAHLSTHDDAADVMDRYFQRISHPAMTDIKVDFGGATVAEMYPARVNDLFVGRPLTITGRVDGELPQRIQIIGTAHGEHVVIDLPVDGGDTEAHRAVATLWARYKIADLTARAVAAGDDREYAPQILQVALEHSLMSAYTAFIAVDASHKTEGTHGTTVRVAVPVPDGVRYETTVEE